jgi:hypothetical protein
VLGSDETGEDGSVFNPSALSLRMEKKSRQKKEKSLVVDFVP